MLQWHMVSIGVYEATHGDLRFLITGQYKGSTFINPKLEVFSKGHYTIQRYRTVGVCKAQATRIAKRRERLLAAEQQTITSADL